jgi:V8-like Glu-specific endopeptidase
MASNTRTSRMAESTIAEDPGDAASTSMAMPKSAVTNRIAAYENGQGETADEVAGTYVSTPTATEAGSALPDDPSKHEPVQGSGSATEFDPVQSPTESAGEEVGLESVEGYSPPSRESGLMAESEIPEAFTADANLGDKEFWPILAKLAPLLVSTVLPVIRKRVLNRRTLGRLTGVAGSLVGKLLKESGEATESDEAMEAELEAAAEQMEVIIGTDDRIRIRNTTAVPWRRICHLTIRARNGQQYVGTGFLIGKRTVVTAGHCVFIHAAGGWPAYIDVSPARNGATRPFGTVRGVSFRSVTGWTVGKSRDHDYGVIILPPDSPVAVQSLGGFGFGYWADHQLQNRMVNLSGYPGDGGKLGPDRETASQWWMARAIKSVLPRSLAYDIDTVGGQSGSPVWTLYNGQRIAVGIHTNGFVGGNSATRITQPVFNNLKAWRLQGS